MAIKILITVCLLMSAYAQAGICEPIENDLPVVYEENGLYGLKDNHGSTLLAPSYQEICGFFIADDGKAYSHVIGDSGYGIINEMGIEILPCIFDSVLGPSEGFIVACGYDIAGKEFVTEFYTVEGEATGWIFDIAAEFHDGYAAVTTFKGEQYLLDKSGCLHSIEPYKVVDFDGFSNGRLLVRRDYLYGYMDTSLESIIPCIYDKAGSFRENGTAVVQKEGKEYIIDIYGNTLMK